MTGSKLTGIEQPQYKLASANGLKPQASSSPMGNTPSKIRTAYGFNQITFNGGVVGDGSGQTIAIIDAYDAPTIVNDLQVFDTAFGLADPPSFNRVAENGSTNYPTTDPAGSPGAGDNTWEIETALDVEWAHALAPGANILLVEANSASDFDLIQSAVNYARSQPGVVAVSMSFSGSEFSSETSLDTYFTTPSGHGGVTFLAATGDTGQPSGYPPFSPNVVAVGGTTLSIDSAGNYLGETGWSGSGGSVSKYESQPSYQSGIVTQSSTRRANPDVAFDADPNSGVAIYDSYDFGTAGWIQVGGTSFATSPARSSHRCGRARSRNWLAIQTCPAADRLAASLPAPLLPRRVRFLSFDRRGGKDSARGARSVRETRPDPRPGLAGPAQHLRLPSDSLDRGSPSAVSMISGIDFATGRVLQAQQNRLFLADLARVLV